MSDSTTTRSGADWSNPGLLAGRSRWATPAMLVLILIGSAVDTFAFKTTLDVFLREQEWISWGMAIAITVVAQLAAWTGGVLTARWRHHDPSITGAAVAAFTTLWVALGMGLWYVRWQSAAAAGSGGSTSFGATTGDAGAVGKAHAGALLFLVLFLISGLVTAYEAYSHTNPWFTAVNRTGARRTRAQAAVVRCASRAERARLAAAHHSGEWDRDMDRRTAAIMERKALGNELASLARLNIAQLKQDPSITDICSNGPVPDDGPDATAVPA